MAKVESYNEAEVVGRLTQIYKLQEALCYYPDDSIVHAPPGGHMIDETACERVGLAPAVISLMKKIPYPVSFGLARDHNLVFDSPAAVYIESECILRGRDPERYIMDEPMRVDLLKPTEVALTFGGRDGYNLLLDTEDGTIRWWAIGGYAERTWPDGTPQSDCAYWDALRGQDEDDSPHSFRPKPATEVLQQIIDNYLRFEMIPYNAIREHVREGDPEYSEAKRRLMEDYGWPDHFDNQAFKDNLERVWWEIDPENMYRP